MQHWTKEDYQDKMSGRTVVVKYGTDWCKPCRKLESYIDSICSQFPNLEFVSVDADEMPGEIVSLGIFEYPTTILFCRGAERSRYEGMANDDTLHSLLTAWNILVKNG